jgi:CubicO group peptidase (beta-lactamase class C family)
MQDVKFSAGLLLCCLLATPCFSQGKKDKKDETPPAAQSIAELQQQLEKILQDSHTPGVSVAIVHKDGPEWIAGLGKADVAADRANSPETLFRIGSTSKAFASLSILKLANEGKLSLQDSVRKLAPDVWFENRWEETDPVRVVDLLEHTTGWDDLHFRGYAKDAAGMSLRDGLAYEQQSRVSRWRPGTRMAYCNSGPAVAAYIVEKITGERFEDYVARNFFEPMGMKTATYFQPTATPMTTLYHTDGKTPYPYWNILIRPAGAINASANDMAAYLGFYLNRGSVNGAEVMPASSVERMENSTRTWGAQEGMKAGYGLGNYWSFHEGYVYHGHNGGVEGGLTELAYMPDYGVGYFYSINSGNGDTFQKIGTSIRAYVTRELQRPALPAASPLPANAGSYAGWYEPDSPRSQMSYFIERVLGLTKVSFDSEKMLVSSLGGENEGYIPVGGMQFREVPKEDPPLPAATAELLAPNSEGQFIQMDAQTTMRRVPAWFAISEIVLTVWIAIAVILVLAYAPFWLLRGLSKKRRRPAERAIRCWPLLAVLSLVAVVVIFILSSDDLLTRMGNLTIWSAGLFLSTVAYGIASVAGVLALWFAPKQEVRKGVYRFSVFVVAGLLIAAAYFAYWGFIGLRPWA